MDTIVTSVIPLFSMIFIGFFAGKIRLMDQHGVRTLVAFVFTIAMPALLFRLMARTDFGAIEDWPVIGAYFVAQAPIFLGGMLIGRLAFRQSLAEMTIQGFGSAVPNTVILGLPLVLSLYGERGGVPALLIIMLDIVMFSIVTLLLEIATRRDRGVEPAGLSRLARDLVLSVLQNPIILASILGILVGLSGAGLPSVLDKTLAFAGQAGPPAGLFALGASLALRTVQGKGKPVVVMVGLKLALHPILAWLVVTRLFELDPVAASVAILFAACPVGANTYVFAEQYNAAIETSASAVLVSTGLAMATISSLILLL